MSQRCTLTAFVNTPVYSEWHHRRQSPDSHDMYTMHSALNYQKCRDTLRGHVNPDLLVPLSSVPEHHIHADSELGACPFMVEAFEDADEEANRIKLSLLCDFVMDRHQVSSKLVTKRLGLRLLGSHGGVLGFPGFLAAGGLAFRLHML